MQGELIVLGRAIDYSRSGLQWLHRKVGIVLQDPDDQLFGATVEQDVAFGPLNNGIESVEARKLVMHTLESLGIAHLADRPIHELSLGEKKRVALAGVLVLDPEIILLDEPTAGLDFVGITSMLNLLGRLHQTGTTIVISTHDTDLAYEWAEEAWVLMDGHIAAQGRIVGSDAGARRVASSASSHSLAGRNRPCASKRAPGLVRRATAQRPE